MKLHPRSLFLVIAVFLIQYSISFSQCEVYTFDGELGGGGNFGGSVASAGDVNNDGIKDYIIGASKYDASGFRYRAGRAYVYSGRSGEVLYVFTGEAADDRLGSSLACAGDVNNDGYDDVIIGAHRNGGMGSGAGRAYVFSGKTGDTLYVFSGESEGDVFGWSVASAGDVDLDGYDDVIIGAPFYGGSGRVYIFSGQTGDILQVFDNGGPGNYLGMAVSSGADVNQDGWVDLILGVPNGFNGGTQYAYVVTGHSGDTLFFFDGGPGRNWFGKYVSWAGDVDLDGYIDLLVGAPGYYNTDFVGRVYVFSGRTGDTLLVLDGESTLSYFGNSVCSVGDVNNDFRADFLVGAWGSIGEGGVTGVNGVGEGEAYVFSGRTGEILQTFSGEEVFDHFGHAVASSGSLDIDGYVDFIIGAPVYNDRVYVYSDRGCKGTRGDFNGDGVDANILDLTYLVDFIFRAGPDVLCPVEGDINSDGSSGNILDLTFLIDFKWRGGPAPGPC